MTPPLAMTLQQLRHFVVIAALGQVSRAADRCGISQPSMTSSLQNLEAAAGTPLLVRRRAGFALTAEGERFLRYAQAALTSLSDGIDDVRRPADAISGSVRLGITDTITGYLLPTLRAAARRRFPAIALHVHEHERAEVERDVLEGRADLGLTVSMPSRTPDLVYETLIRSPRRLWTSINHPLSQLQTITLADVASQDYVLLDMDEHVETVRRYWDSFGLTPRTVFRSKSIEGVRSLVAQGVGVTILSDLVFRRWSHDGGRIRREALSDAVPSMDINLVKPHEGDRSTATGAFVQFLRDEVDGLTDLG